MYLPAKPGQCPDKGNDHADITARTTIPELQQGPPALMQVLKSSGLYRDGDDPAVMLGQLCRSRGLNPESS